MSRIEKLRRAVGDAYRAADAATTAAWRAHRKMVAVTELAAQISSSPTVQAFLKAEVERLAGAAFAFESESYGRRGEVGALAELMGAKERP